MKVTIQYSIITSSVNKQLSLLGKKSKANDGSSLFSQITLSTIEAQNLTGYVKSGFEKIFTELRPFVTSYVVNDSSAEFDFSDNKRWQLTENMPNSSAIAEEMKGYLISYAIAEILLPDFQQLAEKFVADANNHMDSLSKIFYYKKAPASSTSDYSAISGEVTTK